MEDEGHKQKHPVHVHQNHLFAVHLWQQQKNQNISKNKMNVKGIFFKKRARERERERGQNVLYHIHMTVLCVCYKTEVDERTNFVMITLFQWWLIAQLVRATAFLPSGFIRICDNDYRGLSVLLSAAVCLNACVLQ